eukprot:183975-Pelagomonas_calceolata.AAC.4
MQICALTKRTRIHSCSGTMIGSAPFSSELKGWALVLSNCGVGQKYSAYRPEMPAPEPEVPLGSPYMASMVESVLDFNCKCFDFPALSDFLYSASGLSGQLLLQSCMGSMLQETLEGYIACKTAGLDAAPETSHELLTLPENVKWDKMVCYRTGCSTAWSGVWLLFKKTSMKIYMKSLRVSLQLEPCSDIQPFVFSAYLLLCYNPPGSWMRMSYEWCTYGGQSEKGIP